MKLTLSARLAVLLHVSLIIFWGSSSFAQQQFAKQLNVTFAGDPDVELAAEGAVVIAGNTLDGLLVAKINQNGQPQWQKRFSANKDSLSFGCLRLRNQTTAWVGYRKDKELGVIKLSNDGSVVFNKLYPSPPSVSEPHQAEAIAFTPQTVEILQRDSHSSGRFIIENDGTFRNAFATGRDSLSNASAIIEPFRAGYIQAYGNQLNYSDPAKGTLPQDRLLKPPFQRVIDLAVGNTADHFYALISKSQEARSFIVAKLQLDLSSRKPFKVIWQSRRIRTKLVGRLQAEALEVGANGKPLVVGKANVGDFIPRFRPAIIRLSKQGDYEALKILTNRDNAGRSFSSGTDVVYDSSTHTHFLVGYEGRKQLNLGKGMVASWGKRLDTQYCVDTLPFLSLPSAPLEIEPGFNGNVPNELYGDTTLQTTVNSEPLQTTRICKACDTINLTTFNDTNLCQDQSLKVATGFPKAEHQWSGLSASGHQVTIQEKGSYQVIADNGCSSDTASFQVDYQSKPEPNIRYQPKKLKPGDTLILQESNPAVQAEKWAIQDATAPFFGDSLKVQVNDTGKMALWLNYQSLNDCRYTDTFGEIAVYPFNLLVPNAFSPNGDAVNESFKPYGQGIKSYRLTIYNRWGRLIFEGTNKPWGGLFQGQAAAEGVYLYKLEVVSRLGRTHFRDGTLTLLK